MYKNLFKGLFKGLNILITVFLSMWQADAEMVPMSSEGIPWNSQEKMGKTLALYKKK